MEFIIIPLAALFASFLTLFSGFGLGTILLPVFALFFPIEIAITLTAIVHFLNNIFKSAIMFRFAELMVVLKFGLPAILAAFLGAWLLILLTGIEPLFSYSLFDKTFFIEPIKLTIAILIFVFALFELIPRLQNVSFEKKYLPLGGLLSGFFGGLSGHQGALRSAFLIKMNLSKESFIATGIFISLLIDVTRLTVYSSNFFTSEINQNISLLIAATVAAFAGALTGRLLLKKVTLGFVRILVGTMLIIISLGLASGIL